MRHFQKLGIISHFIVLMLLLLMTVSTILAEQLVINNLPKGADQTYNFDFVPDTTLQPYWLRKGNYYVLNGNLFLANSDSLIYLNDTSFVLFRQKGLEHKEAFFENLQQKAEKNIITRQLYKQIIRPSVAAESHRGDFYRSDLIFIPYKGKTIQSVSIKKIGMYGISVQDTSVQYTGWYSALLNKSHLNTRDSRINRSLLFKTGDTIDPFLLADNEQLLRSFPFIQDARIFVNISSSDTNLVDITIVTQDAYPLVIGGTMYNLNNSRLDISNNNLLGLGHQFINKFYFNLPTGWEYNYNGQYRVNNIGGSFINSQVEYYHVGQQEYTGLRINRNFITPATKYAGQVSLYRFNDWVALSVSDSSNLTNIQNREFDSWFGRNYHLTTHKKYNGYRSGFNLAARYTNNHFIKRPFVSADSNKIYQNYYRFLFRAGFSMQQSFESNMIYSSGTTEDIPTGWMFETLAGFTENDFSKQFYIGGSILSGMVLPHQFYSFFKIETGTFLNSHNRKDAAFAVTSRIFSPLVRTKYAMFRQFVGFKYFGSHASYLQQPIDLTIKNGIREFPKKQPTGSYLMTAHFETVYYPRLYYYGFGFTYFSFLDMGLIAQKHNKLLDGPLYSGIGAGLRVRNQNFVFNSVEIRLCWYPRVPVGTHWSYYASSEQTLDISRFSPGLPEIVQP